jgi:hypothetical protein
MTYIASEIKLITLLDWSPLFTRRTLLQVDKTCIKEVYNRGT